MKKILIRIGLLLLPFAAISAEGYTLQDYIKLVEENNKDLSVAKFDQKLAINQKNQARSALLPMVGGSVEYNRNLIDITQEFPVGVTPIANEYGFYPAILQEVDMNKDNDFAFTIGLQQTVFDMKVFKALEASKKYIDMTGTIYEAKRQAILTVAKQLYYQAILLDEVYMVKKATEQNAYENLQDVKMKYDNELASELDVLQAEVNWQINIPETSMAARNRDLVMSNLKHLAGINQEEDIVLSDSLNKIHEAPEKKNMGDILNKRPDYQALQSKYDLGEINISTKMSEFFPTLTASAGYGWQKSDDNFDLSDGKSGFKVGLTLSVPVFYGGVRIARMEQARLELNKTEMEILKKQDDIQTEINNLQLLLEESAARIQSAETTLKTAEKAYSIAEISSRSGLSTQLDLNDVLLKKENAQLNYYKAIFDYMNAYFNWQQAIGEGDEIPFL